MKPRIRDVLAALPARQLNLIAIGAVLIALALAWNVGLRGPFAAYRQQKQVLAKLEARAKAATTVARPAQAAPAATQAATHVAPAPLALIASVSRSAAHAGVAVTSAAQGARQEVAGLRLHTIDIAASGSYAAILAWLADVEASQPTVGIVQLSLGAADSGATRKISLQLAIYDTESPP